MPFLTKDHDLIELKKELVRLKMNNIEANRVIGIIFIVVILFIIWHFSGGIK